MTMIPTAGINIKMPNGKVVYHSVQVELEYLANELIKAYGRTTKRILDYWWDDETNDVVVRYRLNRGRTADYRFHLPE